MDNDRFARSIKNARLKKGYTQSQLADLLKVSNKTISKWAFSIHCSVETGEKSEKSFSLLSAIVYLKFK